MEEEPKREIISGAFRGALHTRFLKSGDTSLFIPIPEDVARLVGLVVVQWGAFELRMDCCIKAFYRLLLSNPPQGWETQSFKKEERLSRKSLFAFYRAGAIQQRSDRFSLFAKRLRIFIGNGMSSLMELTGYRRPLQEAKKIRSKSPHMESIMESK